MTRCSSLVQMESGTAVLLYHSAKLNCEMMLKLSTSGDKGANCWHACTESSTSNPQNIKTHVQILIDFSFVHCFLNTQLIFCFRILDQSIYISSVCTVQFLLNALHHQRVKEWDMYWIQLHQGRFQSQVVINMALNLSVS
jgi:hypothetical protein